MKLDKKVKERNLKGKITEKSKKKHFKKKKFIKKEIENNNMPSNSIDFSKNWKSFLELRKNEPKSKNKTTFGKTFKNQKHESRKRQHSETEEDNTVWFDDVDPSLIARECKIKKSNADVKNSKSIHDDTDVKENVNITKYVALDCEMVGVGLEGKENVLARVSLVNSLGDCIYDKFVAPKEKVVDYRTEFSGVRQEDLKNAPDYETVQKEVATILKDRILVGHALQNDLKVLMLSHSRKQIRDTAKYKPFRELLKTKQPALRKLAASVLNETIQSGEHSSVVDARATMSLYQLHKKDWERSLRTKNTNQPKKNTKIFMGKVNNNTKSKNKWQKRKQDKKNKED